MMGSSINKKSPERRRAEKDLYEMLVKEGVSEVVARDVVEQTPADTRFKKEFFGQILADAAQQYLAINRADYVEYDNWQKSRVGQVPGLVENYLHPSINVLQEMLTTGPFPDMLVRLLPRPDVVFFQPEGWFDPKISTKGCLMTKEELVLFLTTVDVVLTNNAFKSKKPSVLLAGLDEFLRTFFSNKIELTFEVAEVIVNDDELTGSSNDPQDWVTGHGIFRLIDPNIDALVAAARKKYSARALITVQELDRMIDNYMDLVLAKQAAISITDAHMYLSVEDRATARQALYNAGAQDEDYGAGLKLPESMEEMRESFISRGYTFDQIEILNEQLENLTTKESVQYAIDDPDVADSFGPIHKEILKLFARLPTETGIG